MVKKEKLFQRQIDKVHFDDVREVPAPIHSKAMPAIAQDARDLMLSTGILPPPSRGQNPFDDEMSFFDKSTTEGIVSPLQKPPKPLWRLLPAMLWATIHSEFFIILLRVILIILFAVSLSYLAKLLRPPTAPNQQCESHRSIIFCLAWGSFALVYSCLYFMVPFSRELSLLPALRKRGILIADSVGLMLSAVSAAVCWEIYNSWHCDSGTMPLRINRTGGGIEAVECGRRDNCSDIQSSAIVSVIASIFWLGAFVVTFNQLGRRKPRWVSPAVKTWEL